MSKLFETKQFNNLIYKKNYVSESERNNILNYIDTLHPIWEMRYSQNNPPPDGNSNRKLLRPVYWLGNWQFACLNYFHPPKNIENCCVQAEPFPQAIQNLASRIEEEVHHNFHKKDIPHDWYFNTCLINFYGHSIDEQNKIIDCARVGEHKDFEPGPVGSISFGERALFQFVQSFDKVGQSRTVLQQWLDDCSLQVFGGDRFKKKLFHRIQRVDHKRKIDLGPKIANFSTRRVNLTFRYVPDEYIIPFNRLPIKSQSDIKPYIQELSLNSIFYANLI